MRIIHLTLTLCYWIVHIHPTSSLKVIKHTIVKTCIYIGYHNTDHRLHGTELERIVPLEGENTCENALHQAES